ncbi:sigma-54-dependent transcriptional regulator [Marimonas arenosa]|uniref:Nif-specific regulatory protein n=1 Tax=Marimonas arenosa TaxID=1795305 RepID=A0AAE4B407_9RHOB|nr:sigma-54 dependent transcriptional regulator [Marimonas arenosa]MDQ2088924.1 sigma-54 dependent transcriptional regulator [Marimonas arenosa]
MNKTTPKKILLVEDDQSLNKLLVNQLEKLGFNVASVLTGQDARAFLESATPDLVLLDLRLPDCNGLDLMIEVLPRAPVITMTAYGAVDQAVKAVRTGASDYLVKPVGYDVLELAVERAFETAELKRDVAYWQSQARRAAGSALVGDSPNMAEMRHLIELYSAAGPTVLIEGESGTGKELVARSIHEASDRAAGRFVPIDCDPNQENSLMSELFGHEQGAFPGAESKRQGMFEFADQGTVFLSDIAEVSQAMQSRILRVLETGKFRRLGGAEDVSTNVRILLGTSHNLHDLVEEGHFRSELYFRLSAFRIVVPALRDRGRDVIMLAQHFLDSRSFQRGADKTLAPETLDALIGYDWPGNVRELRNAIERGVIVSGASELIVPQHVSFGAGMSSDAKGLEGDEVALLFSEEPTLEHLRTAYLRFLLERHNGNRRKVAKILGISERNTYRLISRLTSDAT